MNMGLTANVARVEVRFGEKTICEREGQASNGHRTFIIDRSDRGGGGKVAKITASRTESWSPWKREVDGPRSRLART
jgi:hypothetical protein